MIALLLSASVAFLLSVFGTPFLIRVLRARGIDNSIRLLDLKAIPRGANGKVNRAQLKAVMLAATAGVGNP